MGRIVSRIIGLINLGVTSMKLLTERDLSISSMTFDSISEIDD